jgi:predicted permease
MVESLLLAAAGGLLGVLLSVVLARGLLGFLPYDPANLSLRSAPDLRVLAFTAAATLLTALVFGLVPALQASRTAPGVAMKEDAGAVAGGQGHVRLRKTLVALQVGVATVLLIGASLFVRTLQKLREVDLGFRTENVVMFGVQPATPYDEARKRQVFRALVEGLARVPGVAAVGANRSRLLTGGRWDSSITIPGVAAKDGDYPWSFFNAVTPGYFEALRIPIKAGRDFTWDDWGAAQERCLVNEALVSQYLEGRLPLGRRMGQGREVDPTIEIIGVFANARYEQVRGEIPRQTFVSMGGERMRSTGAVNVYARTDRDPRQVMPALRAEVRRVDASLVISDLRTLDAQLDMRLSNERMLSALSTAFAGLATLLSVVGLYGVLAFVVTRRTREIGIRMALGAERRSVIRLVLGEMGPLVALGTGAGLAAALAGGRYVESQLFGVAAREPLAFALSAGVLLAASLAAGLVPAWRASRIEPVRALRQQ